MENELIRNLLQVSLLLDEFKIRYLREDEELKCEIGSLGTLVFIARNKVTPISDTLMVDLKNPVMSIEGIYHALKLLLNRLRNVAEQLPVRNSVFYWKDKLWNMKGGES